MVAATVDHFSGLTAVQGVVAIFVLFVNPLLVVQIGRWLKLVVGSRTTTTAVLFAVGVRIQKALLTVSQNWTDELLVFGC